MSDLLGGLRWAEGIRQRGDGTMTTNDFCVLALADEVISLRKYAREMEAKLSLYTSWQPSDPGTKEAMEWAETLIANPKDYGIEEGPAKPHLEVLVRSTRAAMVRLEEAEKALVISAKAIDSAIMEEDGLDGNDGEAALRIIDTALAHIKSLPGEGNAEEGARP